MAQDYPVDIALPDAGPLPGEVWLVGAGPGDPGLLTLRAVAALRAADVVFHDALPGPEVLALARPGAQLVDVGKRKGCAPWRQVAISGALVGAARRGARVVRLKGGDPFVFGRGGEEAAALAEAGIPWRVVPGVTAGIAAPAAAGIPVTHRGAASAVTFVTGHGEDGSLPENIDWAAVARTGGTIVAFMALTRLDELALRLMAAGRADNTPVAVIARATMPGQRILHSTLATCAADARGQSIPTPALVVIGEVVAFAADLAAAMEAAAAPAAGAAECETNYSAALVGVVG
jgi:uroporphyrin-III C-methyltransferase